MSKLNIFALFGILFLSSVLLGSGMYSINQIYAFENQTGTENEVEVEADIEQENKCKKDTECENENEINNSLNIVNNGTKSPQQPELQTCEECFTNFLTEEQIAGLLQIYTEQDNLGQLCDKLVEVTEDAFSGDLDFVGVSPEIIDELINCLKSVDIEFAAPGG